ncbi:MAG: PorT family protein [Cyclobacteriaceae bacterium]|nr:outer membrane beta-barrel protein [Cyclobacteriaceae bacterium]MCH8515688.1 PorT family protein [Cyclobacteriaceae bacterium]
MRYLFITFFVFLGHFIQAQNNYFFKLGGTFSPSGIYMTSWNNDLDVDHMISTQYATGLEFFIIKDKFSIQTELQLTNWGFNVDATRDEGRVRMRETIVQLPLLAKYHIKNEKWGFNVGAGAAYGLPLFRRTVFTPASGSGNARDASTMHQLDYPEHMWSILINLGGGYELGKGELFSELQYQHQLNPERNFAHQYSARRAYVLSVGYRFYFGKL